MPIDSSNINQQYLPASFTDGSGQLTVSKEKAVAFSAGVQAAVSNMPEAKKNLFLTLLKSPGFAPKAPTSPADLKGTLASYEAAAGILSNVAVNPDSSKLLARIMVELAGLQRKEALDNRLNARLIAKAELDSQASGLKESAAEMRNGAITNLVAGTVGAAVSAGASIGSMSVSTKVLSKLHDAGKTGQELTKTLSTKLEAMSARAGGVSSLGGTAGGVGNMTGSSGSTFFQASSKVKEADASMIASQAEVTKSEGDINRTEQQALDEMIKQLISFLKELGDAKVEQMAAITRG